MAAKRTEKTWGYEELIYNGKYCCKKLVYLYPGIASSMHFHSGKHETFVVANGLFRIESDHFNGEMRPGDSLVLPAGTVHRIRCIAPGTIIESSTKDNPDDCTRLEPSECPASA